MKKLDETVALEKQNGLKRHWRNSKVLWKDQKAIEFERDIIDQLDHINRKLAVSKPKYNRYWGRFMARYEELSAELENY